MFTWWVLLHVASAVVSVAVTARLVLLLARRYWARRKRRAAASQSIDDTIQRQMLGQIEAFIAGELVTICEFTFRY
jgi:hypothetical protein